jgi:steroid 5-alpha reductase family enzyme
MFDLTSSMLALAAILGCGVVAWIYSVARHDVGIVDVLWSLMFLVAAIVYITTADDPQLRGWLLLGMVAMWSIRLATYIAWRSHGQPEDHRYQTIRANNEPGFQWKSLYLVFILQGSLAWVISMPLQVAIQGDAALGWLDLAGVSLWLAGLFFEAVSDYQLAAFRADPANRGKVLDRGLWRYSRHPNYFGNFCIWWGFYLIAASAGGWWTIFAPLLMTGLLLKVSGVALLEKTIGERRPGYAEYVRSTNAFFPGPRSATPSRNTQ